MVSTTIVYLTLEDEPNAANSVPPAIVLQKPPNEITLGDIKRYYHGPEGVFLFKTMDDDDVLFPETQEEKFHWTILTEDFLPVPVYPGGIHVKIRPIYKNQMHPHSYSSYTQGKTFDNFLFSRVLLLIIHKVPDLSLNMKDYHKSKHQQPQQQIYLYEDLSLPTELRPDE